MAQSPPKSHSHIVQVYLTSGLQTETSITQLGSLDLCVFAADNNLSFCPSLPRRQIERDAMAQNCGPGGRRKKEEEEREGGRSVARVACLHQGQGRGREPGPCMPRNLSVEATAVDGAKTVQPLKISPLFWYHLQSCSHNIKGIC